MSPARTRRRPTAAATAALALALVGLLVLGGVSDPAGSAAARAGSLPEPTLRDLAERRGIHIGSAVDLAPLRTEPDYAEVLSTEFSAVVAENAMKFGPIHPEPDRYDFADADALVDTAEANGQLVRGHTLVWHQQLPSWLEGAELSRDEAIAILRDHITTVVGRYRGRVAQWDVVNEALPDSGSGLRDTPWLRWIGPDYLDLAFEFAHEADPDALLFYNDYDPANTGEKSDRILDLVAAMAARGVPIDGVGMQFHVFVAVDRAAVDAQIQRARALGLRYAMTEVDVALPLPATPLLYQEQAVKIGTLLDACVAEVATCTTFMLWGFTDRHSWIPSYFPGLGAATPLDEALQPKPAWQALRHALDPSEPPPPPLDEVPALPPSVPVPGPAAPAEPGPTEPIPAVPIPGVSSYTG